MMISMRTSKLWAWIVFFILWQATALLVGNSLFLPGLGETFEALTRILGSTESYLFLLLSALRLLIGLASAFILGSLLGLLCGMKKNVAVFLMPLSSLLKTVPVVSFIMLAILWLGSSGVPIFITFLMTMPIFWSAAEESVLKADRLLIEMMRVFKLSFRKKMKAFYLPWAREYLRLALRQSVGLGWKAAVAAEVISFTPFSIGRKIQESKTFLETADLFAWTFLLLLMSFMLERLVGGEAKKS